MDRPIVASLVGLASITCLALGGPGWAAPPPSAGDLDASFGSGGQVTTDFPGSDVAQALAIQVDGRIVVAGESCSAGGGCDFAVARYLSGGALDGSFGSGGKVTTDFGASDDEARGLALQADGKIVVAGIQCIGFPSGCPTGSDLDFAVARYNPDGSLDATFGIGGKVTTDFSGASDDRAYGVAIQADGRIVAAGRTCAGSNCAFALARYDGAGALDPTFGSGGRVTTDFTTAPDGAFALVVQPADGRIVAAGESGTGDFALARYNTDGSLDGTFGSGGKVTTDFEGSSDIAFALAVQGDGRLVAAGRVQVPSGQDVDVDFGTARYEPDGSLDAGFGVSGRVATAFASHSFDIGRGVAVQADGRIVVAGFTARQQKDPDFGLLRYEPDGTLDNGFGKKGKVTTDFSDGGNDGASSVAVQADGRIVAAGLSQPLQPLAPPDFALARYLGQ
jgi:uncharacterized delta-60 repeat protein